MPSSASARRPALRCALFLLIGCVVIGCVANGCVGRSHYLHSDIARPDLRLAAQRGASAKQSFAIDTRPEATRVEARRSAERDRGEHRAWELSKIAFGHQGETDGKVRAVYFQSPEAGPRPLVLVLPIYGSSQFPPRQLVKSLLADPAHRGSHVLLVESREDFIDWKALRAVENGEQFQRQARRVAEATMKTVVDLQHLLDWASARPEVDDRRLGLVGFSIGTMVGSLVLGIDDRIDSAVFVMGGANVHQVLASCRGRAGETRRLVLETLGWTAEDYERHLANALEPINPARWVGGVDPAHMLLIDASFDNCVPEEARERLWEAMGRPERISLSYGHRMAFLSMTPLGLRFTSRKIVDFLADHLDRPRTAATSSPRVAAAH